MSGWFRKTFKERIEAYFREEGITAQESINKKIEEVKARIDIHVEDKITENINSHINKVLSTDYVKKKIDEHISEILKEKVAELFTSENNKLILFPNEKNVLEQYIANSEVIGPISTITNRSLLLIGNGDICDDINKYFRREKFNLVYIKSINTKGNWSYIADTYFRKPTINNNTNNKTNFINL